MKLIKTADGKIKITKEAWKEIGKKNGWYKEAQQVPMPGAGEGGMAGAEQYQGAVEAFKESLVNVNAAINALSRVSEHSITSKLIAPLQSVKQNLEGHIAVVTRNW
jgi:hypothetical protein